MNIPLAKNGIKCEWMLELIDAKTGKVERTLPWQKNTILDTGMAYFIKTTSWCYGLFSAQINPESYYFDSIAVGSGTTMPTFTDTILEGFLGAKSYDRTLGSISRDYSNNQSPVSFTLVASFNENEANGTIAEMGLLNGTTNTAGKYFCRNRLVDADGNPTTIVKDSAHLLKITARITVSRVGDPFVSIPITEVGGLGTANHVVSFVNNAFLGDILLSGSNGPYSKSSSGASASSDELSLASGSANVDYNNVTNRVGATINLTRLASGKTGDDYWIDFKYEIPQTAFNINIKTLCIDPAVKDRSSSGVGNPSIVCIFETPLPKDSTKKLYLTFRHTWTRS